MCQGGVLFYYFVLWGYVHLSFEKRLHIAQASSLSPHSKVRPTVSQACPTCLWEDVGAQNPTAVYPQRKSHIGLHKL